MQTNTKKKWFKPKLIVLVRGDGLEENILSACKNGIGYMNPPRGPTNVYNYCTTFCAACFSMGSTS